MEKLISKPSYYAKLQKFKEGGQIQKCQLGDMIEKGAAYLFNGYDGTFDEAFRKARKDKKSYFRWNGKLYSTKLAPTNTTTSNTSTKVSKTQRKRSAALRTNLTELQKKTVEDVWNYLQSKGVSARNSAAIMGNIMQESSFNRNAKQQGGDGAVGFFQMHGQDLKAYNTWKSKNKVGKYPEIDYVLYMIDSKDHPYTNEYNRVMSLPQTEQNKSYIQKVYGPRISSNTLYLIDDLNNAWNDDSISLNDITDLFVNTIERAGKPEYTKRQNYAQDFYDFYYGN